MALSDNLQGWWCPSLDTAGNGTTTLTDLSGNGNHGTLTNMDAGTDWVTDTDSGGVRALDFNGLSQRVVMGNAGLPLTGDLTLSFWFLYRSTASIQGVLSQYTAGTSGRTVVAINQSIGGGTDPNRLNLYSGFPGGLDANVLLSGTDTYYHIVLRRSGSQGTVYINGVLAVTDSDWPTSIQDTPFVLGAFDSSGLLSLDGRIDNTAIWDRALTAAEVTQLYNGGRSLRLTNLSTGLQGWWCPSLDTAGNGTTTLTDLSGNGNNGTLTDMDAATDWVADTDSGGVRAVSFDGSGAVVADGSVVTANQGTIALWVKPINWVGLYPVIVSNRNSGSNLIEVFRISSNWAFRYGNVAAGVIFPGAVLGSWIHLAVAWDAVTGIKRAWVNGVNLVDATGTWTPPTIDGNFVMGAADVPPNFGQGAESYQDSIAIYNRVLSSDEISQLYSGGRSLNLLASGGDVNIAHVLRAIQQQQESVVVL